MESNATAAPTLRDLGFIDVEAAAILIDVKPLTLATWRVAGKGPPATKIHGNKIVYSIKGIEKWLAERTVGQERPGTLSKPPSAAARRASRTAGSARGARGGASSGR